ncbi:MAG: hypothetical protein ISR77_09380 [Pirellulaceae bacterium]|nr:hypothetical protein [Pirellulaceae bacterium]
MGEALGVLCGIGIVVTFVTLLGHGLWVVIALFFRWLSGSGVAGASAGYRCPQCGAALTTGDRRCTTCGFVRTQRRASTMADDVEATIRQLNRMRSYGLLGPEQHAGLMRVLRDSESGPAPGDRPVEPAPVDGPAATAPPTEPTSSAEPPVEEIEIIDAVLVDEVAEPADIEDAPEPVAPDVWMGPVSQRPDHAPPREAPKPESPFAPAPQPSRAPASHALEREYSKTPPAPPVVRQTLADMLKAFMAEKNIRWGELISGMLIVGSAVGLVISLRATLSMIPYFTALGLMAITLGIHGAGLYTLRRWDLQATSRGLLIIALLLTPLVFVAAIFSSGPGERPVTDPIYMAAVAVGVLSVGWITFSAGRALLLEGWWRLTAAMLATCVGQLIVDRATPDDPSLMQTFLLVALPVGGYLIATLTLVYRATAWRRFSARRVEQIFVVLGISTFALLPPLGLFVSQCGSIREALARLTPSASLCAAAVLATGLLIHRRALTKQLVALRTAGTGLAIFGTMLMGAAVVLAWPQPDLLIAVGLANFVVLVILALAGRLPLLHVAAVGCLALTALVGFHVLQGSLEDGVDRFGLRLVKLFAAGRSGIVLSALAIASGGVSLALSRLGRPRDAIAYLQGCGALAAVSVLVAAFAGFGPGDDTALATPVLAFYAVGALAAAIVVASKKGTGPIYRNGPEGASHKLDLSPFYSQVLSWTGIGLLLATLVQALWLNEPLVQWLAGRGLAPQRPVLTAMLLHANLCALMALAVSWAKLHTPVGERNTSLWQNLVNPLGWSALVISTLALPWAIWGRDQMFAVHAVYMFGIALAWLIVAIVLRLQMAASVVQGLTTVGVAYVVAAVCQGQEWGERWWIDPRHVQAQLGVLAAWCAGWSATRRLIRRWPIADGLARPEWPTVDQVVLGGLLAILLILSIAGCCPGLLVELGMADALPTESVHQSAFGVGSWIALGLVVLALLVSLWEEFTDWALGGVLLAAAAVPLLVSAPFEASGATATAMRWSFAIYALITAATVWLRGPISQSVRRLSWLGWNEFPSLTDNVARGTALLVGGLPVVVLTTIVACRRAAGLSLGRLDPESLFGSMDATVSYAGPLLMLVAVFVGHALRERSAAYALAGSGLLQYVVSLAYLLSPSSESPELFWAGFLQWNATALAGYALVWLALDFRIQRPGAQRMPLEIQMWAAAGAIAVLTVWCACSVFATPSGATGYEEPLGGVLSYVAWGLALVAAIWFCFRQEIFTRNEDEPALHGFVGREQVADLVRLACWFAAALVALIATTVDHPGNVPRDWLAYHVLTFGWLVVAAALTVAAWRWQRLWREAALMTGLVAVLAVRGCWSDPHWLAPWWSVCAAAAAAVLAGSISLRLRSQSFAYASVVLVGLASTFFWIGPFLGRWVRDEAQAFADLVQADLVAVVLAAGFWLAVEIWYQRKERQNAFSPKFYFARVHVLVAIAATVVSAMLLVGSFGINVIAREASGTTAIEIARTGGVLVLGTLGLLLAGSLWDRRGYFAIPMLYVWGALVVTLVLDRLELGLKEAFFAVGVSIAGYVALTGLIWRQGAWCASVAERWGITDAIGSLKRTATWLPVINMLLATASMLIGLVVVLFFEERWMRISSGFAPVLLAVGLGALAQKERRTLLQFMSLLMTGAAAVYLSWADLKPEWDKTIVLDFAIRLLIVLSGLTFIYSVLVARRISPDGDWMAAVRRIAVTFGIAAIVALVGVLCLEAVYYDSVDGAPVGAVEIAAVGVVLVALIAGLISLALLPGRDPLALTEKGRMGYVYAAEVVGTLLFVHIYLCIPELFSGRIRPYWPYIIWVIALVGAGLGEWLHRSKVRVLAEPLHRTGAFLPLVAALGMPLVEALDVFSVIAPYGTHYPTLLFLVGLMYMILSILRRSVACGLAAAVAANVALWSLFTEQDLLLWRNPQFWLIPPAASVLIAAHINRRRLTSAQLTAVRYASILVIYLSSTSEIFIRDMGKYLWPPMILAGLSIAGVFLGMILRVRAFIYLGSSFVLLSIVGMVWHAQKMVFQHSWPWWAFGIGSGISILVLFGVFEKKRPEITRWIERLQEWEK